MQSDADVKIMLAEQVLTVAVLSILLTAPIGAIGILAGGPRLLTKSTTAKMLEVSNVRELEVVISNNSANNDVNSVI